MYLHTCTHKDTNYRCILQYRLMTTDQVVLKATAGASLGQEDVGRFAQISPSERNAPREAGAATIDTVAGIANLHTVFFLIKAATQTKSQFLTGVNYRF